MNQMNEHDVTTQAGTATPSLSRLFRPRSIAVIGGGAWCNSVVTQCQKMGFDGPVWPVHPKRSEVGGVATYPALADLPGVPDATFIGVNRHLTIETVRTLREMGAGGAVCFASGFREAQAETGDGNSLQATLLEAAGEMPIIGPNCYGFINYLDGALLWPDQHGGVRSAQGVAILTQSSNMAINLTMQARGLPLAYVVTAGNQAQIGLSQIGRALLADDRVTALGMHIEGVGDLRAFEALADDARRLGKPLVALKAGKSAQARAAAISHTASLSGSDAGARALFARLGIAQVDSLTALLETLKLLHFAGPLPSSRIVSMSCSGGEASLMADSALGRKVSFPPLSEAQHQGLRSTLGPMVALANPLDYHTFIWNDTEAMADTFAAALSGDISLGCLITDYPREDRCDTSFWDCTITAGARASASAGKPLAIVATLPEALSEAVAARIAKAGLIPMHGLDDTLTAIEAAAFLGQGSPPVAPVIDRWRAAHNQCVERSTGQESFSGIWYPGSCVGACGIARGYCPGPRRPGPARRAEGRGFGPQDRSRGRRPWLGEHRRGDRRGRTMEAGSFLVEEMIAEGVVELLVGVVRDPAHGFVLTLAAGGTLTEILRDNTSLLLPVTEADILAALDTLRIAPLLAGYRGKPAADRPAIVAAVLAVQAYVTANASVLDEVEINPLICTPTSRWPQMP